MNEHERKLMMQIAAQVDRHEKEIQKLQATSQSTSASEPIGDFSLALRELLIASFSVSFRELAPLSQVDRDRHMQYFIRDFLSLAKVHNLRSIAIVSTSPPPPPPPLPPQAPFFNDR